jgi:hypothetical protein
MAKSIIGDMRNKKQKRIKRQIISKRFNFVKNCANLALVDENI